MLRMCIRAPQMWRLWAVVAAQGADGCGECERERNVEASVASGVASEMRGSYAGITPELPQSYPRITPELPQRSGRVPGGPYITLPRAAGGGVATF